MNYGTPYHLPGQVRYKQPDHPEAKVPERETTLHSWLSDSDEGWPEGNWSDPDDPVPDRPTERQIREAMHQSDWGSLTDRNKTILERASVKVETGEQTPHKREHVQAGKQSHQRRPDAQRADANTGTEENAGARDRIPGHDRPNTSNPTQRDGTIPTGRQSEGGSVKGNVDSDKPPTGPVRDAAETTTPGVQPEKTKDNVAGHQSDSQRSWEEHEHYRDEPTCEELIRWLVTQAGVPTAVVVSAIHQTLGNCADNLLQDAVAALHWPWIEQQCQLLSARQRAEVIHALLNLDVKRYGAGEQEDTDMTDTRYNFQH